MNKNDLFKLQSEKGIELVRIIETEQDRLFVIDCIKRTMPKWVRKEDLSEYVASTEDELYLLTKRKLPEVESLDRDKTQRMYQRYTLIAGLLPFVSQETYRNTLIGELSKQSEITKQTIRNYLCLYLVYMDITALAPKEGTARELTTDEKNMRWGLNKFYYTRHKNSLQTAYTMMLQAKYCDGTGSLLPEYPTFNQFRYFFRKHKNMRTYYISRDGVKSYERNNRPLLGDGVQEYASHVGVGMFDATICDIYLVDDRGNLVGRPTLTACVDAYSSLCMGYDEKMEETTESIKKYGVLVPGIARPRAEGGYEIIAGHRRKRGSERAGKSEMPVIVRNYTDDEATIIMVDSNIQREDILPSEKAKAYYMKYEAMKHQGSKSGGLTLDEIGEKAGESGKTVQRYIWLARLSDELLELVDNKKIGFVQGVDISFLTEEQQQWVLVILQENMVSISTTQSGKLKEYGKKGELTLPMVRLILREQKQKERKVIIKADKISQYFPADYDSEEIESVIYQLLEEWKNRA